MGTSAAGLVANIQKTNVKRGKIMSAMVIGGGLRQISGGLIIKTIEDRYVLMVAEQCYNGQNVFPADNWEMLEEQCRQQVRTASRWGDTRGAHSCPRALWGQGRWS